MRDGGGKHGRKGLREVAAMLALQAEALRSAGDVGLFAPSPYGAVGSWQSTNGRDCIGAELEDPLKMSDHPKVPKHVFDCVHMKQLGTAPGESSSPALNTMSPSPK